MMVALRLFLSLFVLIFFLGCEAYQKGQNPLRIGTNEWPGYEPLHYAAQKGLYQTPVKMVELSSASEVIRAYKNKTVELAALTLDEVLLLRSQGYRPTIIAVLDISNGGDVIIAHKEIPTMAALKGKRVGLENTALGSYVITRALEIHKLDLDDITVVPLEFGEHQNAFEEGRIDAVVTFEPVKGHLLAKGYPMIFSSKEMPKEIVDVLVVREDLLSSHQQALQKIISATLKAQDAFNHNMQEVSKKMAMRYQLTPQAFVNSFDGLKIPQNSTHIETLNALNGTISKLSQVMQEKKLIPHAVNSEGLITTTFLQGLEQ